MVAVGLGDRVVASTSTAALNSVFFSTELLHTTHAGAGTTQPGKYVLAPAWPQGKATDIWRKKTNMRTHCFPAQISKRKDGKSPSLFLDAYGIKEHREPKPFWTQDKRNEKIAGSLLWHSHQLQSTTCYLCAKNMMMINSRDEGKKQIIHGRINDVTMFKKNRVHVTFQHLQ